MFLQASTLAATLVFVVACWVTDVQRREIPNQLSGIAFVVGIVLNVFAFGGAGLVQSLAGALAAVAIMIGPFALGGIGGGDVKMMGAVGALLGPNLVLHALAVGFILGGLVMIVHLAAIGRLGEKLTSTCAMFRGALSTKSFEPMRLSDEDATAVTLPYSVPLGLGTVAVLLPGIISMGQIF